MRRILHIVHTITRGDGIANMIINYYRVIDRTKLQFDFLYFRDSESDFKTEIESLGGRCFKMTEPSICPAFFRERAAFFLEHRGEFDAVHCHALFAAAVFAGTARKYGAAKIISHSHSSKICGDKANAVKTVRNYFFIKATKLLSDYHLASSRDAARFMYGEKALKTGSAIIICNAFDCERYKFNGAARIALRTALGIEGKLAVGHVGAFAPVKNHGFLIDIFYELQKTRPDSVLLLIGGDGIAAGSTKAEARAKAERLGLADKVLFLGLRDDVDKFLSALDVFVFPSLFEGLGIALVEAQAAGLPCVVSGAVPEEAKVSEDYTVIDGFNDPARWAAALEGYAGRKLSKRLELSPDIDKFDIEKQKSALENFYLSINIK